MGQEITRLREAGLVVFAGVKKHVIEDGVQAPASWPVAHIVIRRSEDESIKANTTNE